MVVLKDDEPNGLSMMLADLIRANILRHPERVRLLRPTRISIRAADIGLSCTLRLEPGKVTISNGSTKDPDVKVRSDASTLVELTTVPLRFRLPDPFRRAGRAVVSKVLRRQLLLTGAFRHPFIVARLMGLLSVH